MPRGKKQRRPPRSPEEITATLTTFAKGVEDATPAWLDAFMERQRVLLERFHEKDEEGDYKASVFEQTRIHASLAAAESNLMRFAAIREQIAVAKGVSHLVGRESQTTNHLTLNFSPGATPEQKAMLERLYLASVAGKEIEATPILQIPAAVSDAKAS